MRSIDKYLYYLNIQIFLTFKNITNLIDKSENHTEDAIMRHKARSIILCKNRYEYRYTG